MASNAVCLPSLFCHRTIAPQNVNFLGHDLQVVRINAHSISAKMIRLQTGRYVNFMKQDPRQRMSIDVLLAADSRLTNIELAVA